MRTATTDQTGRMPRLIGVFAECKGHFVAFSLPWLIDILWDWDGTRDFFFLRIFPNIERCYIYECTSETKGINIPGQKSKNMF